MSFSWRTTPIGLVAAAVLTGTMATAATPVMAAPAADAAHTLGVDLAHDTGPLQQGATGGLYALSQDGVPSANVLAPLRIKAVAQKPSGSVLHPGGDVDHVAPGFFSSGGQQMFIYMQDLYPTYPYPYYGSAEYSTKVDQIAADVTSSPYRDRFVYVPFNEPDITWYRLDPSRSDYQTQLTKFLADWKVIVQGIRKDDPGAKVAGPNTVVYNPTVMRDFFTFAQANDVLPSITTWHELSTDFYTRWRGQYDAYRALERSLGFGPLPINIDEYANRRDQSVPGQLVQWVSRFEASKVDAMLPYWDVSENLNDNVVQSNQANGAWWFEQWYAALTGRTAAVTPPSPDGVDTLQGIATKDSGRRQAQVLFGGTSGTSAIAVSGIDAGTFTDRVHVRVERTTWSGYDAAAPTPPTVLESDYRVVRGRLTVTVPGLDPLAAYRLELTPGHADHADRVPAAVDPPYEAEDADITAATVSTQGTPANPNVETASGTQDVGSINKDSSRLEFSVDAPATGRYDASILYGNETEQTSVQYLQVDNSAWQQVDYPATLNYLFRARKSVPLYLSAGPHTVTLATRATTGALAERQRDGEVTLDAVDLTYETAAADYAGAPAVRYDGEWAQTTGRAGVAATEAGYVGSGYLTVPAGATATTPVTADHDGYATLAVHAAGPGARVSVNGTDVTPSGGLGVATSWTTTTLTAHLRIGINLLTVIGARGARFDAVTVTPIVGQLPAARTYEAEAARNRRTGTAQIQPVPAASGGHVVGALGGGTDNNLTFTGVTAPVAGTYEMVVDYSNNDRTPQPPGYGYNAGLIDRYADISIDRGPARRVYFRNTYSWDTVWSTSFAVTVAAGTHTVAFVNASAGAPNIDRLTVAPVTAPGTVTVEAEARGNALPGRIDVTPVTDASGGAVVTGLSAEPDRALVVRGLRSPSAGKHTLLVAYRAPDGGRVRLGVGASSTVMPVPGTGGPSRVSVIAVPVTTPAGAVSVTLAAVAGSPAPDVDAVTLVP